MLSAQSFGMRITCKQRKKNTIIFQSREREKDRDRSGRWQMFIWKNSLGLGNVEQLQIKSTYRIQVNSLAKKLEPYSYIPVQYNVFVVCSKVTRYLNEWMNEWKREKWKKIAKRQTNSNPHQICVYAHGMQTVYRNTQPLRFLVINNKMKIIWNWKLASFTVTNHHTLDSIYDLFVYLFRVANTFLVTWNVVNHSETGSKKKSIIIWKSFCDYERIWSKRSGEEEKQKEIVKKEVFHSSITKTIDSIHVFTVS